MRLCDKMNDESIYNPDISLHPSKEIKPEIVIKDYIDPRGSSKTASTKSQKLSNQGENEGKHSGDNNKALYLYY